MIKKFIICTLELFLTLIVFVNLVQFAQVPVPSVAGFDFLLPNITTPPQDSYFGLTSIYNFFFDLSVSTQVLDTNSFYNSVNELSKILTFGITDLFNDSSFVFGIVNILTGGLIPLINFFVYLVKFLYSFVNVLLDILKYILLLLSGSYNIPLTYDPLLV